MTDDAEDRGDRGVDLRCHAEAEARVNLHRQRVILARQENGDGDWLSRAQGERQQRPGDDRGPDRWKSHPPKRLPPACRSEVGGSLSPGCAAGGPAGR